MAEKVSALTLMTLASILLQAMNVTVGVLALQGAFYEHLQLLKQASRSVAPPSDQSATHWIFLEVRTTEHLSLCDALIIPGGESTTISLVAARSNLLDPLRDFVKYAASV